MVYLEVGPNEGQTLASYPVTIKEPLSRTPLNKYRKTSLIKNNGPKNKCSNVWTEQIQVLTTQLKSKTNVKRKFRLITIKAYFKK